MLVLQRVMEHRLQTGAGCIKCTQLRGLMAGSRTAASYTARRARPLWRRRPSTRRPPGVMMLRVDRGHRVRWFRRRNSTTNATPPPAAAGAAQHRGSAHAAPLLTAHRTRNPCFFLRLRTFGWKVRFTHSSGSGGEGAPPSRAGSTTGMPERGCRASMDGAVPGSGGVVVVGYMKRNLRRRHA